MANRNDNTYRVLFFVTLIFLWLLAGTVAFAGSAAAQKTEINAENLNGQEFWQGSEIIISFNNTGGGDIEINAGDTVQLRQVTQRDSNGNPIQSTTVFTTTTNDLQNATFDTSSLEPGEQYVVRGSNDSTWAHLNASGEFDASTLSQLANDDNSVVSEIGISTQTLSTTFENNDGDNKVRQNDTIGFQLTSPERGPTFSVNVSETNGELNNEELQSIFFGDDGTNLSTAGVGTLEDGNVGGNNDEIQFSATDNNFDTDLKVGDNSTEITPGTYTLKFEIPDTTAESSASLVIGPNISSTNLNYTFEIPNDGETYSVGIPGEVEGSLADMIDPTANGYTVFRFENGGWVAVSDFENTELDALDAIAIATENRSGQQDSFTFEIEFANQSATSTPPQSDLDEGWNFVPATQRTDADSVFGIDGAFLVLDRFEEPQSTEVQSGESFENHFIGSDQNTVSPFKGYYIYVESDTTLPGVLSGVETRDDINSQLNVDLFE